MGEREDLLRAIERLESQRDSLGTAAVDTAVGALRQRLAGLPADALTNASTISARPGEAPLAGERRTVTVVFADMSGFTALSDKLDPESIRAIVNGCFERFVPIIRRYDGVVDKFIGDEVMALFGAPTAHENDPERAVRAALDMMDALSALNRERKTDLGMHIGINTGLAVAGDVGSGARHEYSVMGDAVNLASRLADAGSRGQILVGPDTYGPTAGLFEYEQLPPILVKGKPEPITPYRLVRVRARPRPARGLDAHGIRSALVGRSEELDSASRLLTQLVRGTGSILFIVSEAGLGKSRLLAELRERAHESAPAPLWLEGRSLSFDRSIGYWPFQSILWQCAGINEGDGEAQAWGKLERRLIGLLGDEVAQVLPYLASLIRLPLKREYENIARYLDSDGMRRQIYLAARRFFEKLAQERPLVLVLEDLHWSDESSLLLLSHLLPLTARAPILICATSRPPLPKILAEPHDSAAQEPRGPVTDIRLEPLSRDDCTRLLRNLCDLPEVSAEAGILGKAEGNPFFMEEVIRSLIDSGVVTRDPSTGRWIATPRIKGIAIPSTIQALIMARVDRLDDDLKRVLRTAAVIGNTFLYRVLAALEDADRELDGRVVELERLELLRERQREPELEYMFRHGVTHEATYESILHERRRELHARVGQAIERLFSERLEEFYGLLAYHYVRAEKHEKARHYLVLAADQSGKLASDTEALAHYERALASFAQAFGDSWNPQERADLEMKMGMALRRRGEYTQAKEYLYRALEHLGRPLPRRKAGTILAMIREILRQVLHRLRGLSVAADGRETYDPAVVAELWVYELLWIVFFAIDPPVTILVALRALNAAERHGVAEAVSVSCTVLGLILDFMGLHRLADRYVTRGSLLEGSVRSPSNVGLLQYVIAIHHNIGARWSQVLDHCQRAMAAYRGATYSDIEGWSTAVMCLADAHIHLGNFSDALAHAEQITRTGQESGDRLVWSKGLSRQGYALRGLGRIAESAHCLEKALGLATSIPDYQAIVDCAGELGLCHLRREKPDEAITVFEECAQISATHGLTRSPVRTRYINGLAEALLVAASSHATRDAMRRARGACRDALQQGKAYLPGLPEAMMLMGTCQWLGRRRGAARRWWARSAAMAERMGVRYDLGRTRLEMGRRLNDPAHLREAERLFQETGSGWELSVARECLESLSARNSS